LGTQEIIVICSKCNRTTNGLQEKRNKIADTKDDGVEPRSKTTDMFAMDNDNASKAKIDTIPAPNRKLPRSESVVLTLITLEIIPVDPSHDQFIVLK